jgi:hypothetical protein
VRGGATGGGSSGGSGWHFDLPGDSFDDWPVASAIRFRPLERAIVAHWIPITELGIMAKRKHTYERAARKRKALERAKAAARPPRPSKGGAGNEAEAAQAETAEPTQSAPAMQESQDTQESQETESEDTQG